MLSPFCHSLVAKMLFLVKGRHGQEFLLSVPVIVLVIVFVIVFDIIFVIIFVLTYGQRQNCCESFDTAGQRLSSV